MHDMISNPTAFGTEPAGVALDPAAAGYAAKGIAFEIGDLIRAKSWAAFNDSRMFVRLDHGSEDEEYEEVIEFHKGVNSLCRVIMWRNHEAVFIQPMPGRKRRHASVAEALESLHPKQPVILADEIATVRQNV